MFILFIIYLSLFPIKLYAEAIPENTNVLQANIENSCIDSKVAQEVRVPQSGYHAKYHTFIHDLLSKEQIVGTVTPGILLLLDTLIDEAHNSLHPLPKDLPLTQAHTFAQNSLRQIDCILLRHGFVYPGHGAVQLLWEGLTPTSFTNFKALNEVYRQPHNIRRRAFINARHFGPFYLVDCDLAAFLFVMLGEVLGYPIQLVDIPNHIFVSWTFSDGTYLYYETMDGIVTDNHYYQQKWHIPVPFMKQGGILQAMTITEAKAYHIAAVAETLSWQQSYRKMKIAYELSIALDARRPFASHNLASFYLADPLELPESNEKALYYATMAATVFPSGDNLDTLACAYAKSHDFKKALIVAKQAADVGYTPFNADIYGHKQAFLNRKTCDMEDFGRDLTPFR